jgi:hypothetical protein
MKITRKNRVYGIEDSIENLKIVGDIVFDSNDLATLNARVTDETGENGGGTVYYQELLDGQVSMSFSGNPKCGGYIYLALGNIVANAKKTAEGPQEETSVEETLSETQDMPEGPTETVEPIKEEK